MRFSVQYHQAIALNNMGVSLLKKRAFGQAMETFRGALNEMKMLVHASQGETSEEPMDLSSKVEKAYQALVCLGRATQDTQVVPMVFDSVGGFHLPSVLNLVMDEGCHSSMICPIKIELADFENMGERDADLDSAIMLYNMALVHRSVAAREHDVEKHARIHKAALRLFRMAFTLVSNTPLPEGRSFEDEQTLVRNRVHGSAVFLYYQTRTLFDMAFQVEGERSLRHLSILGSELADMMDVGFVCNGSLPTAAAA